MWWEDDREWTVDKDMERAFFELCQGIIAAFTFVNEVNVVGYIDFCTGHTV
jgi:hypothetical protein